MTANNSHLVNYVNPQTPLLSILRDSTLPPNEKLAMAARLLAGLRLKDLAAKLGCSPVVLSRALNSPDANGKNLRRRACGFLGIEVEIIFGAPDNGGSPAIPDPSIAAPEPERIQNEQQEIA